MSKKTGLILRVSASLFLIACLFIPVEMDYEIKSAYQFIWDNTMEIFKEGIYLGSLDLDIVILLLFFLLPFLAFGIFFIKRAVKVVILSSIIMVVYIYFSFFGAKWLIAIHPFYLKLLLAIYSVILILFFIKLKCSGKSI